MTRADLIYQEAVVIRMQLASVSSRDSAKATASRRSGSEGPQVTVNYS
jgi:hypothetical protein